MGKPIDATICFTPWCGEPIKSLGLCGACYTEHKKKGTRENEVRKHSLHKAYFQKDMGVWAYKERVRGIVDGLPIERHIKTNFVNTMVNNYQRKLEKKRGS